MKALYFAVSKNVHPSLKSSVLPAKKILTLAMHVQQELKFNKKSLGGTEA